jgi:hypothetical protein
MEITDKDRLDFIEENELNLSHWDIPKGFAVHDKYDEFGGVKCPSIRDAIDNAIMAMREKDK